MQNSLSKRFQFDSSFKRDRGQVSIVLKTHYRKDSTLLIFDDIIKYICIWIYLTS